jgi:hypothetical protein
MTDSYLIWSHEHSGWWRPGGLGYSSDIDSAGRFTRTLDICRRAPPGQYKPGWPLPELPIAVTGTGAESDCVIPAEGA